MWGGGTRWRPKPSSLSPSGGFRTGVIKRSLKVADLGQIRGSTMWWWIPKSPMDHMWQSRDYARIWCKTAISLLIPQRRVFARNLFNKIDAEAPYLPYTSVKIHLPVSCELRNQICALYSKHALYKLWGRGRTLQSASLHSRGNISVESHDQEQELADHSSS